jgi:hypothetical protein
MSRVDYADPLAPAPSFGVPQTTEPDRGNPRAVRAVRIATIPFGISIVAHFIFFVAYWLPETDSRWQDWWLNQLAPLASQYLSSGGEPISGLQEESTGIAAVLLLILSVLILWMARSHYWVARTWIWAPVLAGAATCVVTIALLAANQNLGGTWVSVVLMICWVAAAAWAAWLSMIVDIDSLPPRGRLSGLAILIAYAVLGAPPTAVGRLLFAPELREVAAELQNNTERFRTAALAFPAILWLYLAGVLAGVVVWLLYQLLPPRRGRRSINVTLALVASFIALLALGVLVARPEALQLTDRLRTESPIDRLRSACGSWIVDPAAPIKKTVVIEDHSDCRQLITYEGYVEREMQMLPEPLAGVRANTPEGVSIRSRLIAARYGNMLVIVSSGEEDGKATTVRGLLLSDGIQVWQWRCESPTSLTLRFAGVQVQDDPSRGYITLPGETQAVVVGCPAMLKHLDPRTGLGKP